MIFFMFFIFVIIITVQICKFNSWLLSLLSFSYFITPYDAQASSAFSALIFNNQAHTNIFGIVDI